MQLFLLDYDSEITNNQIPSSKQIPMTQDPMNPNENQQISFWNFGDWDFGHYLIIGVWSLVIIQSFPFVVSPLS